MIIYTVINNIIIRLFAQKIYHTKQTKRKAKLSLNQDYK